MNNAIKKNENFDAINILKEDHKKVKSLFDMFENSDNDREKKKIVAQVIMELKLHAAVEEEIFYPAVRKPIGKEIMNEADEEHHVAKILIAELEEMDGSEDYFDAKFKVLSENVRHHIKEEEGEMMPKARKLDLDMDYLGEQILNRKEELKEQGIETCAEEQMVSATQGTNDSPAETAKKTKHNM